MRYWYLAALVIMLVGISQIALADVTCGLVTSAFQGGGGSAERAVKEEFRKITDRWAVNHNEDPSSVAMAMRAACQNSPALSVQMILATANGLN